MNLNELGKQYSCTFQKQHDYICGLLDDNSRRVYLRLLNQIPMTDDNCQEKIFSILSKLQQVFIAIHQLKAFSQELESYQVDDGKQLSIQKPEIVFTFEALIVQTQATLDATSKIICTNIAQSYPHQWRNFYFSKLVQSIPNGQVDLSAEIDLTNAINQAIGFIDGIAYNSGAFQGGSLRNLTAHELTINDLVFTEFTINGYPNNKLLRLDQYVNDFPLFNSSIILAKAVLSIGLQTIHTLIKKYNRTQQTLSRNTFELDLNWETQFVKWKDFISDDSNSTDTFSFNKFGRGVITIREMVELNQSIYSHLSDVSQPDNNIVECHTTACKDELVKMSPA